MTAPVRKVRGRPFQPGNPGRPLGSKNKVTQTLEQLAEGQAEQIFQKVSELAQAGDVSCLRMILDRIWPPRKAQPINVTMPPINSSQDVLAAIAAIFKALGEGRLTPDEIIALSSVVGRSIQVMEHQDLERRIYSDELGVKVNKDLQRIMTNQRYLALFGHRLGDSGSRWLRNANVLEYANQHGSFRNTTVEGQITGQGINAINSSGRSSGPTPTRIPH
jgi:hypothetical protein